MILASAIGMMLPGAWEHSVTIVEVAHLPAGLAAWQRHSFGIYRVCGPVSKLLYSLPAHLLGVRVNYPASFDEGVEMRRELEIGENFQVQNSKRYHKLYRWTRLLPIFVTALGGWLICDFSTRLFGTRSGVASLCLWCWMSPVLAHGSLVTSDILSAVFTVAAAYAFWAFILAPRPVSVLLSGLALGTAVATKFTLLILYPCFLMLLIARAIQLQLARADDSRAGRGSSARLVGSGLLMLLISIATIDTLYFFQDVGFHLSQWRSGRSSLFGGIQALGQHRATAWLLDVPLPIPQELLRGLDAQMADAERIQNAYLLGYSKLGGWWYWYTVASLIKIPLPAFAFFGLAIFRRSAVSSDRDAASWGTLCLLLPAAEVAIAIASTTGTGTNAAFRYLLPSIALLCVWAGRASGPASPRAVRAGTVGLLTWLFANAILGLPDHLGWRNELGWLCSQRRPALIGDSLDWGQDLARLSVWASQHSREGSTVVVAYGLGAGDPYDLVPPAALSSPNTTHMSKYLAISENILFEYDHKVCVYVGGEFPGWMTTGQLDALRDRLPFDRVGRTIRIYRLREPPLRW